MNKNINLQVYTTNDLAYYSSLENSGKVFEGSFAWETNRKFRYQAILEAFGEPLFQSTDHKNTRRAFTYVNDEYSMYIDINKRGTVHLRIASKVEEGIEPIHKRVLDLFPLVPEPSQNDIGVYFWNNTPSGPHSSWRKIAAPVWDTVSSNYPKATYDALNKLFTAFAPTTGGQLILWHGKPGTGKTYALRALCQQWREWCTVNYVLDPEQLFGYSPSYFANVVASDDDDSYDSEGNLEPSKWKLFILEDTGELLTDDAQGQGLARLLNLVDGFIGQGLRVIILITTNVEFSKLHPAVTRDGRCAAEIKFQEFSAEEASKWLGVEQTEDKTLAELYAMKNDSGTIRLVEEKKPSSFGFRMS